MKIQNRRVAILAALSLTLAGGLAFAQTAPSGPRAPEAAQKQACAGFQKAGGGERGSGHGRHGGPGGPGGPGGLEFLRGIFAEADANGDGTLTTVEIEAFQGAQFAAADVNGDGTVSLDEFATVYFARIRPQMVDAFQAFDDDGDGKITSAELGSKVGTLVDHLDRDGDGALSLTDRPGGRP